MSGTTFISAPQIVVEQTVAPRGAFVASEGRPYLAFSHRRSSSTKLM